MIKIASVSLNSPLEEIATELGASFAEYGFAIICDHGIDPDLIAQANAQMAAFFALSGEEKALCHKAGQGGARGYTPFGTERAKGAQVHDLKEFYHIGRDLPDGDPLARFMPANIWPEGRDGFQKISRDLFAEFDEAGAKILSAIAIERGLDPAFFAPTIEQGNSVLRYLHYPAVADVPEGAIRAAAHEDINTITLLLGAEEAGLQLQMRDGSWQAICPPKGALVVNIGDMLQRLTAGHLRSTPHRVVNPSGNAASRARYSMPFFLHFRPDYLIEPLSAPLSGDPQPAITAHDYLMERLKEINLT